MDYSFFEQKWSQIRDSKNDQPSDEKELFTEVGDKPITQRQINLFYYFLFIKKYLINKSLKNILEIGCGRGTMSLFLERYLHLDVTLLDNSSEAIDLAKDYFQFRKSKGKFFVADALYTGLEASSYDATVSIGLAEHIDNVEQLFREQYRLLRSGGLMISLNIPKKFSIQIFNNGILKLRQFFGLSKNNILRKDYYRNDLKPKDYENIARKVGFSDIEIVHVCPFPIYTNIEISTDKKIATLNRMILKLRSIFMQYPFKTNSVCSQAHFLVAYKK